MFATDSLAEFRTRWLPHVTNTGLARLVRLLESASPLLVHRTFTRTAPMGCLASHIGWNHPATADWADDAGVRWLCKVAGLNPATSEVLLAWDRDGVHDRELRAGLLAECRREQERRARVEAEEPVEAEELVGAGW
jgi:hypothetical protein